MNNALMNAILSMDAYNRGYGASIIFGDNPGINNYSLDTNGIQIGTATIIRNKGDASAENISFYALAYDYNGETIIAYRGTDNVASDLIYGWPLGDGWAASQGQMAIDFYNEVVNVTNTHLTLTGHSLGGGLAGFVAAISQQPDAVRALIFDSMDYEEAASALVSEYSNIYIGAYHIEGEVLSGMTPFSPDNPSIVDNVDIGDKSNLGPVDRHSQATLVLGLYAETEIATQTDWKNASLYMWDVLYDDQFAQDIRADLSQGESIKGTAGYSEILRSVIAYSAIDEGTRVFGDTGIRAFYDDANDLGRGLGKSNVSSNLIAHAEDISKVFIEYAGQLALNKVELKAGVNDAVLGGVLKISGNALTVDFSDSQWRLAGVDNGGSPQYDFVNGIIGGEENSHIRDAMQALWGDRTSAIFEKVSFAVTENGDFYWSDPASVGKAQLFVAGNGSSNISNIGGTSGNDLFMRGEDGLLAFDTNSDGKNAMSLEPLMAPPISCFL